MATVIDSFRGQYGFLSNFYAHTMTWKDRSWPTLEHAFQAAKTTSFDDFHEVWRAVTPGDAKRRGRSIVKRPDWESVKEGFMLELLRIKFSDPHLATRLIQTGDARLIEGNTWGDTYWGVCNGSGQNRLGEILMAVRAEIVQKW